MPDEWTTTTWADVEVGDFIKTLTALDTIFRVDGIDAVLGDDARKTFRLFTPSRGAQAGKLKISSGVRVRIRKDGKLTPAGQRFDGLTASGARALREQLGAELVAVKDHRGPTFQPWVCVKRYGTVRQLADHLNMFHHLHVGDVKPAHGPELRRTHEQFHASDNGTPLGIREPHIHNDEAFERES